MRCGISAIWSRGKILFADKLSGKASIDISHHWCEIWRRNGAAIFVYNQFFDNGKTIFPENSKYDIDIPIIIKEIPIILIAMTVVLFFVIRLAKEKKHIPAIIMKTARKRYIRLFLQNLIPVLDYHFVIPTQNSPDKTIKTYGRGRTHKRNT